MGACSQPEPNKDLPNQALPKQTAPSALVPYSYINQRDTIDWRTIETAVTPSRKDSVATMLASFFADVNSVNEDGPHLPRITALHLLDLNGDRQLDAVYNGPVGAESDVVWFFLNDHGRYRKLPQERWGQVKNLIFQNRRLATLNLLDFGCCAEYIEFESIYAFDQQLNAKPVLQRGTAAFTQRPIGSLLASPQAFRLSADSIPLRTRPILDDTSTIMYDAVGKGNILLKFGKGPQGIAWASKVDSLGRQWRYVEMRPANNAGYLMHNKENFPTYTFGWILAKDAR
jgi:hypothetical protein